MPSNFEWNIAQLEGIASEDCQCSKDNTDVDDVCVACKANRVLNRISSDAFDSLKELEEQK